MLLLSDILFDIKNLYFQIIVLHCKMSSKDTEKDTCQENSLQETAEKVEKAEN